MKTTRREFIGGCCAGVAAMAGARIQSVAFADTDEKTQRDIMVVVFLRGGTDGLNFVAPAQTEWILGQGVGDITQARIIVGCEALSDAP